MIPLNGNEQSVPARLFVSIAAIERISRALWWHASLTRPSAPPSYETGTLRFETFPDFDELAEAFGDCEHLLRRLDASLQGIEIRCAGELVTRGEAAVLLAHIAALRDEVEDCSRPDAELRLRIHGVHERVREAVERMQALWGELPSPCDPAGARRAWTFDDFDAYLGTLQAVRRSLRKLKSDPSLRVLVLAGMKHANVALATTCQLLSLVLDFNIEPELLRRLTPRRVKGKK